MINGKIIRFGYGDVLVGCYHQAKEENFILRLTEIKPPQEVGTSVYGKEFEVIKDLCIEATYDEISTLKDDLLKIKADTLRVIDFNGCTLDFTNYNIKSVDVNIRAINNAITLYLLPLAC